MDGYPCPEGMSPEQYAQAQRIMEVTEDAFREERWRMACLLARTFLGLSSGFVCKRRELVGIRARLVFCLQPRTNPHWWGCAIGAV